MKQAKYVGIGGTVLTKKQYEICMKCEDCFGYGHLPINSGSLKCEHCNGTGTIYRPLTKEEKIEALEEIMKMKKKPGTAIIEIKKLQRIAEYYQFPMAVFFAPVTVLKGKTRDAELLAKVREFGKKVKELCEEYWGE